MKIETKNLTGVALDWAVAKAEGATGEWRDTGPFLWDGVPCARVDGRDIEYQPSASWSQGGPIIEREKIEVVRGNDLYFPKGNEKGDHYEALWLASKGGGPRFHGRTVLEAAMRCFVASKLDATVDIPEALCKCK